MRGCSVRNQLWPRRIHPPLHDAVEDCARFFQLKVARSIKTREPAHYSDAGGRKPYSACNFPQSHFTNGPSPSVVAVPKDYAFGRSPLTRYKNNSLKKTAGITVFSDAFFSTILYRHAIHP